MHCEKPHHMTSMQDKCLGLESTSTQVLLLYYSTDVHGISVMICHLKKYPLWLLMAEKNLWKKNIYQCRYYQKREWSFLLLYQLYSFEVNMRHPQFCFHRFCSSTTAKLHIFFDVSSLHWWRMLTVPVTEPRFGSSNARVVMCVCIPTNTMEILRQ